MTLKRKVPPCSIEQLMIAFWTVVAFFTLTLVLASASESSPQQQAQLAAFEREVIRFSASSKSRTAPDHFPPASGLPEAILFEAHRAIFCSMQPRSGAQPPSCRRGFAWLDGDEHRFGGILTESFAVIAFAPIPEAKDVGAVQLRLLMHEQMHAMAKSLFKLVTKIMRPTRQIILVGARGAGGVAELAACLLINHFSSPTAPIKNGSNQFKVVSWDERPVFTLETSQRSPLLSRNHLCFMQATRAITGEESAFASNGIKIFLEAGAISKFSALNSAEAALLAFSNAPFRSAALKAPTDCASAVAQELRAAFGDESVACRVSGFEDGEGTFEVHCAHGGVQFLSFEGKLMVGEEGILRSVSGGRGKSARVEREKKKSKKGKKKHGRRKHRRSSSSSSDSSSSSSSSTSSSSTSTSVATTATTRTSVSGWEACLHQLFTGHEHVRLLMPFTIDEHSGAKLRPWHEFALPALNAQIWQNEPVCACRVRPLNVAHELFQLSTVDLAYFYRLVRVEEMRFPQRFCQGNLIHVSLSETQQVDQTAQLASAYLSERLASNTVFTRDAPISLFRLVNTESFETLQVYESNLPKRQSDYSKGFQDSLLKCVSNPVYKYRDCTAPINHWIPGACPLQCIRDAQAPGCARVKSCTVAGFYVGVAGEGVKQLDSWSERMAADGGGHILFLVRTKAAMWASYLTMALYRQA